MLPLAQVTEWREARDRKDTVAMAMEDNDIKEEALAAGAGYGQEKKRQRQSGL